MTREIKERRKKHWKWNLKSDSTFIERLLDEMIVTSLGNFSIAWVMLALVLILIPKNKKDRLAVMVAVILDSVLCNGHFGKYFCKAKTVRREYCDQPGADSKTFRVFFSFRTHVSGFLAAVAALYFSGRKENLKAALVLAILIAFSRMYLYVHYPTDVLGGIICGIICGCVSWWCIRRFFTEKPG